MFKIRNRGRKGRNTSMENRYELIAPCHFGMESVLKREILELGYEIVTVEDGRITFRGDETAIARANIFIRTAERILLKMGSFRATDFDELFEGTKAIPWEEYLPRDAKFWVTKATTNKSALFSASAIQSIVKKAIVDRMKQTYRVERFEEDGDEYPIRVFIFKDQVSIGLDTSGTSLHKRGYRTLVGKAPISETLAAALLMLTPWNKDRILIDPFCGSGTIPIEAAMMAAQIAPGMKRDFTFRRWKNIISEGVFEDTIEEANDMVNPDIVTDIQGFDIDDKMVSIARENAKMAGVDHLIHFQRRDVKDLSHPKKYGFIITNPPYGERLEDKKDLPELYKTIGQRFAALDSFSMYLITAYDQAERDIGRKADKNRKIYNGMLKTYYYQFMGPKPPKEKRQ